MISEIKANNAVETVAIVSLSKAGTAKNGSLYANGTLEDKSGKIQFVSFEEDIVKKLQEHPAPNAWKIGGVATLTNYPNPNTLQVNIKKLAEPGPDTDLSQLMTTGNFDHAAYAAKINELINLVENEDYNILLQKIFDEGILGLFLKKPASMKLHHAYIGGLLEHTIDVTNLALAIAEQQKNVNKDLIIAGALLHDIGKISELSSNIGFPYTTEGRLLGHIALGALIVQKTALSLEIKSTKLVELNHIILSHHGDVEKGSPIPCQSKEAFIVHYADMLNCIMNQFDTPKESKEDFEFNNLLKRNIYRKEQPNDTV